MPLVMVQWTDAAQSDFDGSPGEVQSALVLNTTFGLLLRESASEIQLVREAAYDENTVRWPYSIPRKLVRRMAVIVPNVEEILNG